MQITQSQVNDLAYHFTQMRDSLVEFFDNEDNQKAYRQWYKDKYGKYPEEVSEV